MCTFSLIWILSKSYLIFWFDFRHSSIYSHSFCLIHALSHTFLLIWILFRFYLIFQSDFWHSLFHSHSFCLIYNLMCISLLFTSFARNSTKFTQKTVWELKKDQICMKCRFSLRFFIQNLAFSKFSEHQNDFWQSYVKEALSEYTKWVSESVTCRWLA